MGKVMFLLPVYLSGIASLIALGLYLLLGVEWEMIFPVFLATLMFWVWGFSFWYGFRYVIQNGYLRIIVWGLEFYDIRLTQILKIEKRRKSTYMVGTSWNHVISLKYRGGELNISPCNQKEFVEEILNYNPRIEVYLFPAR